MLRWRHLRRPIKFLSLSLSQEDAATAVVCQHLLDKFITHRVDATTAQFAESEAVFDGEH